MIAGTADLSFADLRNNYGDLGTGARPRNAILPDGLIAGLEIAAGERLVVRDYDGFLFGGDPVAPIAVTVRNQMSVADGGALQLVFEEDPWDSIISFRPGIPVTLGGALDLTFAADVNPASQVGRSFDIFDWTGVTPNGTFEVSSRYAWDLSNLYTSGEISMLGPALPGDLNFDDQLTVADIDALAGAIRIGDPSPLFDVNHDGALTNDDHGYWVSDLKHAIFGDTNFSGTVDFADFLALSNSFGQAGGWGQGDFDGSGDVQFADFLLLSVNFGKVSKTAAAVPEADCFMLLMSAAIALPWVRRRAERHRRVESPITP